MLLLVFVDAALGVDEQHRRERPLAGRRCHADWDFGAVPGLDGRLGDADFTLGLCGANGKSQQKKPWVAHEAASCRLCGKMNSSG
jgi:hypothetical protein